MSLLQRIGIIVLSSILGGIIGIREGSFAIGIIVFFVSLTAIMVAWLVNSVSNYE